VDEFEFLVLPNKVSSTIEVDDTARYLGCDHLLLVSICNCSGWENDKGAGSRRSGLFLCGSFVSQTMKLPPEALFISTKSASQEKPFLFRIRGEIAEKPGNFSFL
jgi:hypothetical protein